MNYYEHHLGDYVRDTAHLSMLEDGAYRRLMDACYIRERALPLDIKECCKLARANSKPERDAVVYVLKEFFEQREDGYHQRRIDAEIAKFLEDEPTREAKRENAKERQRRTRERRAKLFELLRGHGVTPNWDASTTELESMLSRHESRKLNGHVTIDVTQPVTPVTRDNTATQSPVPNTQYQISEQDTPLPPKPSPRKSKSAKIPIPDDFAITPELAEYAINRLPEVDVTELAESFRGKAVAKAWENANWRQAFQEFVRNASPQSGHWAAGQYPRKQTIMGGQKWE